MKKKIYSTLSAIAVLGNLLYILWIVWNGIDEGFNATPVQTISYIGILVLLALNAMLIGRRRE